MKLLYAICEHEIIINHEKTKCREKIPYLTDQLLVPKYCHFHLPLYANVYFKKQYNKIK